MRNLAPWLVMGIITLCVAGCAQDPDALAPSQVFFTVVTGDHALTDAAREAITLAPDWLQSDMRVNLLTLDADRQDELATLMTHAADPRWLDELAFCLAHVSPTHLNRADFLPVLLLENVAAMYAIDERLDYAEIIEVGDASEGGDYYSTIRYAISEDGVVTSAIMDRDYYYWTIVHPVIEDEAPLYIRPETGSPAAPPTGRFWRDYLFYEADAGYAPLSDYVEGHTVLWERRLGWEDNAIYNGALGGMMAWVQDATSWGSETERPIQPVRIYAKHLGRCGENQDLTAAAGRSALIPVRNVSAWGNDHVWNEFWDEEWIQVEPENASIGMFGEYYNEGLAQDNNCDGEVDEYTWAWDPEMDADGDGYTRGSGDCDDHDPTFNPGGLDIPDGRDNDCDGYADLDAERVDIDDDGVTIANGDCNDWDYAVAPWNIEDLTDGRDNDCDGIADLGLDVGDADGDGYSIAMGDCDDTCEQTYPGALEIADGKDNDCDTWADNGAEFADGDGDGISIDEGDCDDSNPRIHPGALEVEEFQALAVSANRGDGHVTTVTENYGPAFELQVSVRDANGHPVDGATVYIAGELLGEDDPVRTTWGVTDAAGQLAMTLGGNLLGGDKTFHGRVDSPVGSSPPLEDDLMTIVASPISHLAYGWGVQLDGEIPQVDATVVAFDGDSDLRVRFEWELQGYNGGPNHATGVLSRQPDTPVVKMFVVDGENLDRFEEGDPFDAIHATDGVEADGSFELAVADTATTWYLLAAPVNVMGRADVQATVTVSQLGVAYATEEISVPVVAGDHAAVGAGFVQ